MSSKVNKFAFYFPQFYCIPENDKHWGLGFTDWDNVKSSIALFDNHNQPRIPLDGYYDQSIPDTITKQVKLAKKYGLDGFSFYHYWFDGELVLGTPVRNFLDNKSLDLKFSFTWANETWSRRWVGDDTTIIFKQTHNKSKEIWKEHFNYLIEFWLDIRYEKIQGKPIFNIYNPHLIGDAEEMFEYWHSLALEHGLPGIHFVAIVVSPTFNQNLLNCYDGVLDFQPRYSTNQILVNKGLLHAFVDKLRFLPEPILNFLTKIRHKFSSIELIEYQSIWDNIIDLKGNNNFDSNLKRYYGAFVDWDNTPRYKEKGKVYTGVSPSAFEGNMKALVDGLDENDYIFINAWNEWSEGAYLEPDMLNNYKYLEVIKGLS